MPQGALPSADEIIRREAGPRRIAAYTALASALFMIIALIIESQIARANIPDFQATDLAQTLAVVHDRGELPRTFLPAVAQFTLDHGTETLLAATARAISLLLLLPMVVLLIDAVRARGGQLGAWVRPAAIFGYALFAIVTVGVVVLQLSVYRTARDAGFEPADIWDAVRDSPRTAAGLSDFVGRALAGLTVSLAAVQAVRVGLLPKLIGYLGVFIGLLFIVPLEPSGVVRAFWFGALAFVVSGRLANGTPPAWESGVAVAPEPRQPPEPRAKSGKAGKSGKD
jgi:hypothetical protein